MSCTRSEIVNTAKNYVGVVENSPIHKWFIDRYNSCKPLPRGYAVKYTDAWCATFASVLGIVCNATDIIPRECSCQQFIELAKQKNIWKESDSYIPTMGDFILYDWNDSGKGECTGWADHIGIVERVSDKQITVIEGNYDNRVQRRYLTVNGRYIRGFVTPLYKEETQSEDEELVKLDVVLPTLEKGCDGNFVITLQSLLYGRGYNLGKYGIDGEFGSSTETAVRKCQSFYGLAVDGIVGKDTWSVLLAGEKVNV